MNVKEFFKPKYYNIFVKLIAIAIFGFMILMIFGFIIDVADDNKFRINDNYFQWEIVGDSVEALDDGTYKITFDLKNVSAYEAKIDKYSIRYEYGSSGSLKNIDAPYPEGPIFDTLNNVTLPAGQTIKYSVTLAPPDGISSITAIYNGKSYNLNDVYEKDDNYNYYNYYKIDLK